jgi:GNAT superfamily N-acetyltransferase
MEPDLLLLRSALASDQDWLFDTYKSTLKPYVEWAWGWDEAFQREGFLKHHPLHEFQIVMYEDQAAGALHVQSQDTLHFVRIVFLAPEFQNRGLGTRLLQNEMQRAHLVGKALHLKVVKINPAKALYERMGFQAVSQDEATFQMAALPPTKHINNHHGLIKGARP